MNILQRAGKAWNIFFNRSPTDDYNYQNGHYYNFASSSIPYRTPVSRRADKAMVTNIYTRIAMDVVAIDIRHVLVDSDDKYVSTIRSPLNDCFNLSANLDQTGRSMLLDAVISMFDEGVVAIIPTEYDDQSGEIFSMRTGQIEQWYPETVRVNVLNPYTGNRDSMVLNKKDIAIVENPMYSIMNEPNSMLQRLIKKLSLMDSIDEQSSMNKLDIIIQLPYMLKTKDQKLEAERRRKMLIDQMTNSPIGVGYIDQAEKITQLSRPIENNLLNQIKYLMENVFSQMGMTQEILNGTATADVMNNYYSRIIEHIISAFVDEYKRKFVKGYYSKTENEEYETIMFFRDLFKLMPLSEMGDAMDAFLRNEVITPNDGRQYLGLRPSKDPRANEAMNRNINTQSSMDARSVNQPVKEEIQNER